ncbi:hypothetical protein D3C80_1821180 [compost metagenome]
MPDTVQLIAGQVLVDVAGLDDVSVFNARRLQAVVVIGNVDLFLANKLPVVAVRRAIHHIGVVGGAHAIGGQAG